MNLKRLRPVLVCLVLLTACSAEGSAPLDRAAFEAGLDSAAASRDASFIVRARLRTGATGEDAGELSEKYMEFPAVIGTRFDGGDSFALLLAPGASAAEAEAVSEDLAQEPLVEQVGVEPRS